MFPRNGDNRKMFVYLATLWQMVFAIVMVMFLLSNVELPPYKLCLVVLATAISTYFAVHYAYKLGIASGKSLTSAQHKEENA